MLLLVENVHLSFSGRLHRGVLAQPENRGTTTGPNGGGVIKRESGGENQNKPYINH